MTKLQVNTAQGILAKENLKWLPLWFISVVLFVFALPFVLILSPLIFLVAKVSGRAKGKPRVRQQEDAPSESAEVDAASLTEEQLGGMTTEKLLDLSQEQLRGVPEEKIKELTSNLSEQEMGKLSATQMQKLSLLTPSQQASLPQGLRFKVEERKQSAGNNPPSSAGDTRNVQGNGTRSPAPGAGDSAAPENPGSGNGGGSDGNKNDAPNIAPGSTGGAASSDSPPDSGAVKRRERRLKQSTGTNVVAEAPKDDERGVGSRDEGGGSEGDEPDVSGVEEDGREDEGMHGISEYDTPDVLHYEDSECKKRIADDCRVHFFIGEGNSSCVCEGRQWHDYVDLAKLLLRYCYQRPGFVFPKEGAERIAIIEDFLKGYVYEIVGQAVVSAKLWESAEEQERSNKLYHTLSSSLSSSDNDDIGNKMARGIQGVLGRLFDSESIKFLDAKKKDTVATRLLDVPLPAHEGEEDSEAISGNFAGFMVDCNERMKSERRCAEAARELRSELAKFPATMKAFCEHITSMAGDEAKKSLELRWRFDDKYYCMRCDSLDLYCDFLLPDAFVKFRESRFWDEGGILECVPATDLLKYSGYDKEQKLSFQCEIVEKQFREFLKFNLAFHVSKGNEKLKRGDTAYDESIEHMCSIFGLFKEFARNDSSLEKNLSKDKVDTDLRDFGKVGDILKVIGNKPISGGSQEQEQKRAELDRELGQLDLAARLERAKKGAESLRKRISAFNSKEMRRCEIELRSDSGESFRGDAYNVFVMLWIIELMSDAIITEVLKKQSVNCSEDMGWCCAAMLKEFAVTKNGTICTNCPVLVKFARECSCDDKEAYEKLVSDFNRLYSMLPVACQFNILSSDALELHQLVDLAPDVSSGTFMTSVAKEFTEKGSPKFVAGEIAADLKDGKLEKPGDKPSSVAGNSDATPAASPAASVDGSSVAGSPAAAADSSASLVTSS